MIDTFIGVALNPLYIIRLNMCSTLITDFTISFLTIKATSCWCIYVRPLYYITVPLSDTCSPVPFHLTSSIPRKCHLYFFSWSIFPHGCRVRTFNVPIVINIMYCS